MNATDQYKLLERIEHRLDNAIVAASQLPGHEPLTAKLWDALRLASAWRRDQEAELPDPATPTR